MHKYKDDPVWDMIARIDKETVLAPPLSPQLRLDLTETRNHAVRLHRAGRLDEAKEAAQHCLQLLKSAAPAPE